MDPLSITTGVIALGTLAVTVTKTVSDIKKSLRTADQSLEDLANEVSRLTSYLTTVETSLSDARTSSLDIVRIDDKLWEQTTVALSACNNTLKEIAVVLSDVNKAAKSRNGLNRKAKIAACLHGKTAELAGLRDRVGKSNCALQTILHIIQVHVSIQNRETQDVIMRKLEELKVSIDTSALHSRSSGMDRLAEFHINQSLKDLAREARRFHSAASSASSSAGSTEDNQSVAAPWQFYPGAEMSLAGDFTEAKLARVHDYLEGAGPTLFARPHAKTSRLEQLPSPPPSIPASDHDLDIEMHRDIAAQTRANNPQRLRMGANRHPSFQPHRLQNRDARREEPYSGITIKYEDPEDEAHETDFSEEDEGEEESDDEDEAELQKEFLQELKREIEFYIRTGEYAQAISQIDDAMLNHNPSSEPGLISTLRAQLALCHIMQDELAPAEHLMGSYVAKYKKDRDPIVCSLLHALAISQYDHGRHEVAEKTCKLSYFGKKQLLEDKKITDESLYETVGLLAAIYAAKGETRKSNTFRRKWPADFVYKQPRSAKDFLLGDKAMEKVVREDVATVSVVPGYFEMSSPYDEPQLLDRGGTRSAGSHSDKQVLSADYSSDSGFEPPSPASSVSPITPTFNLRRRFTQMFRGRNKRTPVSPGSPSHKRRPSIDSGYGSGLTPVEETPTSASSEHSPWNLFRTQTMSRKKAITSKPQKGKKTGRAFQVRNVVRVRYPGVASQVHPADDDYLNADGRHFDQRSMNHSTLSGSTMVEPGRSPVTMMGAIQEEEEQTRSVQVLAELDGHETERPVAGWREKDENVSKSSASDRVERKNNVLESALESSAAAATRPIVADKPAIKIDTTFGGHSKPSSRNSHPLTSTAAPFVPSLDPKQQIRAVLPLGKSQKISNIANLLTRKTDSFLEAEETRFLLRMALANLKDTKWSSDPMLESDISTALEKVGMKASRLRAAAHVRTVAGKKTEEVKLAVNEARAEDKIGVSDDDDIWWEDPEPKSSAQADVEPLEDDDWWIQDKPTFSRATTLDVAELEATPIEPNITPAANEENALRKPDPKHAASESERSPAKASQYSKSDAPYFVPGELMEEKVSAVNLTKRPIQAYTPTSPRAPYKNHTPTSPREPVKTYSPTSTRSSSQVKLRPEEYVPAIAAHYVAAYGYMRRWRTSLAPDERECLKEMGILG